MTFDELAALRQEDFVDVDGSPNPLPSPESIAAAREIHDAVLALGPVPDGAELEVDADAEGGCAVTLRGPAPHPGYVWFSTLQDGARVVIASPQHFRADVRNGSPLAEQAAASRAFMGWPC